MNKLASIIEKFKIAKIILFGKCTNLLCEKDFKVFLENKDSYLGRYVWINHKDFSVLDKFIFINFEFHEKYKNTFTLSVLNEKGEIKKHLIYPIAFGGTGVPLYNNLLLHWME